jgi:hypothetical protein
VKPTTFLDQAALIHDIEYSKPNSESKADWNLIKNTYKIGGYKSLPILPQLSAIMLLKNLLNIKLSDGNNTDYEYLKKQAIQKGLAQKEDFLDYNY